MIPNITSRDYPADLYASLHNGTEGDEGFYRAVCVGADRVLELGCGSGRILAVLADQVTELHGVDSSEETLALARMNLPASVELQRGDMETFDVGGGFDRVLVPFNGIYCLPDLESVRRTFVQVEKALAADGFLVFDGDAGNPIHEDDSFDEGFDEEDEIATVERAGNVGGSSSGANTSAPPNASRSTAAMWPKTMEKRSSRRSATAIYVSRKPSKLSNTQALSPSSPMAISINASMTATPNA